MFKTRTDLEMNNMFVDNINTMAEQSRAVALAAVPTSKRRSDVAEQHRRLIARLKEYSEHLINAPLGSANSAPVLAEMAGLTTPLAQLIDAETRGNTDKINGITEQFRALKALPGFSSLSRISPQLPLLLEQGANALVNCTKALVKTRRPSDAWAAIPTDVIALLRDVIQQPLLEGEIEGLLEQIRRMLFSADEMEQQQQQAVADGDMKKSELLYFQKVALQESMVDIFSKVFETIDEFEKEHFVAPLKAVHAIHNKTNELISDMIKEHDAMKKSVQYDTKRLKDSTYELKAGDNEAVRHYTDYMHKNEKLLDENARKQDACFAAILELEKRVSGLCDERLQLVKDRLAAMAAEHRRRGALHSFEAFNTNRTKLLTETAASLDAADEATDVIDEFICNSCNSIEQHLRAVEDDIRTRREAAHEMRLQHFRGLYLTLGELQYKKERNLEELDKKIAHTHIQQDLAMDTFDPKAKEFANLKKELLKVREEMESQIEVISNKAVLQIEAFKPTETALIKSGKTFVHPVQELQQRNEARQQKLLEYHRLMGDIDDTEESEGINLSPKKLLVDIEAEERAIEDARAQIQPHRPRKENYTKTIESKPLKGFGLMAELDPVPGISMSGITPKKNRGNTEGAEL